METRVKVLVVDPEAAERAQIQAVLSQMGMVPVCLASGPEAAERIHREKFDGVFLDWKLPGVNTRELIKQIRRSPSNSQVPLGVLAQKQHTQAVARAREQGIGFLLTKPFDPAGLRLLLKASQAAMQEEHRRYQRTSLTAAVVCEWAQGRSIGQSINISSTGMLLQVEPCPELGTRVHLNFLLPEVAGRFLLDGQVTRVGRNGRVAVRFDDLPMDQLDTLLLLYKQTGRKDAKAVKEKVVNQKARAKTPAAVAPFRPAAKTKQTPAPAVPRAGKTHRAAPQAKKVTKVTKAAKGKKAAKAATKPEKAKVKYSSIEQVTKISARPGRSQPDKARGVVNVLVVGEDEQMRTLLGVMLERRGWHIELAESESAGLEELTETGWHLVVVDTLPKHAEGPLHEVLQELQKAGKTLQVLYVTPESMEGAERERLERQGMACLARPVRLHDLLELVSDLLLESGALKRPLRELDDSPRAALQGTGPSESGFVEYRMFARREDYCYDEEYYEEEEKKKKKEEEERRSSTHNFY